MQLFNGRLTDAYIVILCVRIRSQIMIFRTCVQIDVELWHQVKYFP